MTRLVHEFRKQAHGALCTVYHWFAERSTGLQPIFGFIAIMIALPGFAVSVTVLLKLDQVQTTLDEAVQLTGLKIDYPLPGATVTQSQTVIGSTPFTDRNNYIVVIAVQSGTAFVVRHLTDAEWSEPANIGDSASCGQQFLIRILATKTAIPIDGHGPFPEDAIWSRAVPVERTCN